MPQDAAELMDLVRAESQGEDRYIGRQPRQGKLSRVFGGQVAAQALMAATQTVAADRYVHSLHSYFTLGGNPLAPLEFDVSRMRDGGSFTTRRVVATQEGSEIFHLMASFHRREDGYGHASAPVFADKFPGNPESLPSVSDVLRQRGGVDADFWSHEWKAFDMRVGAPPRREGGLVGQRIWFRVREDIPASQVLHRAALTYMSDLTLLSASIAPHGYFIGSPEVQRASLDHAIWFHADVNTNEWLLYDQVSPWAGGGRGLSRAEVFDASGRLVASVVQEGLMRRRDRGRDSLILPALQRGVVD